MVVTRCLLSPSRCFDPDDVTVSVAKTNCNFASVLPCNLFRFLNRLGIDLIALAADKEDAGLSCPDRHVRQLWELVLEDHCSDALRDFFSPVCLVQAHD